MVIFHNTMYVVEEWDGSHSSVLVRIVNGMVHMGYTDDGTTHEVSGEYFASLKPSIDIDYYVNSLGVPACSLVFQVTPNCLTV